jgi:phosphohistidine phosphatase
MAMALVFLVFIFLVLVTFLVFIGMSESKRFKPQETPAPKPEPVQYFKNVEELSEVPDVEIDTAGGRKYVLLFVKSNTASKLVVRANKSAEWHRDIVGAMKRAFPHLSISCPGGGYIDVDPSTKRIRLDRHSGDYGRADHKVSAEIIKKTLPEFEIVTN